MEFGWTAAQREVHERMRSLGARAESLPAGERLATLAAGGALGLPIDRDLGGEGLDLVTTAFGYEGLGATLGDAGVLLAAGAHLFGVALVIATMGTAEQRRRLLPSLARGEPIATVAATEAESGSDIASARTIAEPIRGRARDGAGEVEPGSDNARTIAEPIEGRIRVMGSKRFVTSAARAGLYLVFARDGREGRGLTAVLVPGGAPGVRPGAPLGTAGLRGAALAPVDFDAVEVGEDAVVGRPGAGMAVFQTAMTFERALVLAFRLGAMARALDETVAFARRRVVGGAPIARHDAVAHRIARMKRRLETSRLLVYRAAWELDQGRRGHAEAALAKWHVAESAIESALDAVRVRGGAGYLDESGLPAQLTDALGGAIHSGTEDILATIVARWLGL